MTAYLRGSFIVVETVRIQTGAIKVHIIMCHVAQPTVIDVFLSIYNIYLLQHCIH